MRNLPTQNELRDIKDGRWYWISKDLLAFAPKIKALGIALYNALASLADREQKCFPSQKYLAKLLGYSLASISKGLKVLEREGLIRIERQGKPPFTYRLLRVTLQTRESNSKSRRKRGLKGRKTNKNKLTKNINNIEYDFKRIFDSFSSEKFSFKPESREELLALDLAQGLDDLENLPLYLSFARNYPESLLRMILGEVKEIPPQKLKKGRAALFCYLLKKYGKGARTQNLSP